MEFEFDPAKSRANQAKHGLDFVAAQELWKSRTVRVPALTSDEPHTLVISKIGGKHWTAIVTERAGPLRIISIRRSREKEQAVYEQSEN